MAEQILIASHSPTCTTGYGRVTRRLAHAFRQAGHAVAGCGYGGIVGKTRSPDMFDILALSAMSLRGRVAVDRCPQRLNRPGVCRSRRRGIVRRCSSPMEAGMQANSADFKDW